MNAPSSPLPPHRDLLILIAPAGPGARPGQAPQAGLSAGVYVFTRFGTLYSAQVNLRSVSIPRIGQEPQPWLRRCAGRMLPPGPRSAASLRQVQTGVGSAAAPHVTRLLLARSPPSTIENRAPIGALQARACEKESCRRDCELVALSRFIGAVRTHGERHQRESTSRASKKESPCAYR